MMSRALRRRYGHAGLRVRPFIMWVEDAIRESGVIGDAVAMREMKTPVWRKRFKLWYDTGESVAGAAEMIRKWPWPRPDVVLTGAGLKALRERMQRMIRERGGQ